MAAEVCCDIDVDLRASCRPSGVPGQLDDDTTTGPNGTAGGSGRPRFWKTRAMVDFAHVDALAAGYHRRGGQPGLAYGIVAGGELVHAAGLGERHLGGPPPAASTIFRIATMTKSLTACALLSQRDDGLPSLADLA